MRQPGGRRARFGRADEYCESGGLRLLGSDCARSEMYRRLELVVPRGRILTLSALRDRPPMVILVPGADGNSLAFASRCLHAFAMRG